MKTVIQGEKATFNISLATRDDDGILRPLDLTGLVEADSKVCWQAGSTKKEKVFSDADITVTAPATLGKLVAILDVAETLLFPAGSIGDIEIIVDKGAGDVTKAQILESWRSLEKICD